MNKKIEEVTDTIMGVLSDLPREKQVPVLCAVSALMSKVYGMSETEFVQQCRKSYSREENTDMSELQIDPEIMMPETRDSIRAWISHFEESDDILSFETRVKAACAAVGFFASHMSETAFVTLCRVGYKIGQEVNRDFFLLGNGGPTSKDN